MSNKDLEIDEFLQQHGDALLLFARNLTSNSHSALDLLQDSLIRFYPKWRFVQPELRLAYLKKILVRENVSTWRKRRWREVDALENFETEFLTHESDVLSTHVLNISIQNLPTAQRTAVVLRYVYDYSLNDTADLMKMPVNTVKSHCARGLEALRADSSLRMEFGDLTHE